MSEINTGGHAFPLSVNPINALEYGGMTLRDYFAAKAMTGFLASESASMHHAAGIADAAYNMADAMLKVRS